MAEKTLLSRRLSMYRKIIFKKIWNDNKAFLTMSEIAEIVRHSTSQFYKIISNRKK